MRNAYNILVAKSDRKRPLGRSRRRWKNNIGTDLRKVGEGLDWMHMALDSDKWRNLMNTVMNLRVALKAGHFLTS
jgi:hypothetical protein